MIKLLELFLEHSSADTGVKYGGGWHQFSEKAVSSLARSQSWLRRKSQKISDKHSGCSTNSLIKGAVGREF